MSVMLKIMMMVLIFAVDDVLNFKADDDGCNVEDNVDGCNVEDDDDGCNVEGPAETEVMVSQLCLMCGST